MPSKVLPATEACASHVLSATDELLPRRCSVPSKRAPSGVKTDPGPSDVASEKAGVFS